MVTIIYQDKKSLLDAITEADKLVDDTTQLCIPLGNGTKIGYVSSISFNHNARTLGRFIVQATMLKPEQKDNGIGGISINHFATREPKI